MFQQIPLSSKNSQPDLLYFWAVTSRVQERVLTKNYHSIPDGIQVGRIRPDNPDYVARVFEFVLGYPNVAETDGIACYDLYLSRNIIRITLVSKYISFSSSSKGTRVNVPFTKFTLNLGGSFFSKVKNHFIFSFTILSNSL